MSKILIIAEHANGVLNPSTAKCVACASEITDAEIHVAVLSDKGDAVATEVSQLSSVASVICVDNPINSSQLAAVIAPQVVAISAGYSHIFGPSTTFGRDLMPRVAALLGVNQISDIMEVIGSHKFRRPIYAGNAIVTVEASGDLPLVATVRVASYRSIGVGGSAPINAVAVETESPEHTRLIELQAGKSDRPDLQTASKVVAGGRALGSEDGFELIFNLADALGAAVGASRAAVDAGYVANESQVGQTGKIIAPELYIAIGISGAIQHLTGIKDAGTIVAINKDPDAPIFEVADIGLVGDLFAIVPELQAALST
jgi:electron transfer flavoprotein alpha subunit